VKFFYSDTMDFVDPNYNFQTDSSKPGKEKYWDDQYAHEILDTPPYDGLLISMSSIRKSRNIPSGTVKYTAAEEQRLLREGARKFLRLDTPKNKNIAVMGDCGAFAYASQPKPAYSPEEVCEFYLDTEVDLGVAPDHVIFDCNLDDPPEPQSEDVRSRYEITLSNAEQFLKLTKSEGSPFQPLATVQGWSPASMANAAEALVKMGYDYLAIGGLVPLGPDTIAIILKKIRAQIGNKTKLHLLGFAKADSISKFVGFNITSFDSTSPLIRAFKDKNRNYFLESEEGSNLDYYMAVRVPQALENPTLMQAIKRGELNPENLSRLERIALDALQAYENRTMPLDEVVDKVLEYSRHMHGCLVPSSKLERELGQAKIGITRTLSDRPWERCGCSICKSLGIQVVIFRASNRNKRRGMHNLSVYHNHVKRILSEETL
jgi:hypothetical protein